MKTTKIYDDEKEVYSGNCYVNTVIFRGRIYDDFKEIKSNGIKFLIQIRGAKDDITGHLLYDHFKCYHNFFMKQALFKEEKTTHHSSDEWLP